MSEPPCIECGGVAVGVFGDAIYPNRPDLHGKRYRLCACGAYCGCHPGTDRPLGSPAGPETRRARSAAHSAFDPIWRLKLLSRRAAYKWLSEQTGIERTKCHISMMTVAEALSVVRVCKERVK